MYCPLKVYLVNLDHLVKLVKLVFLVSKDNLELEVCQEKMGHLVRMECLEIPERRCQFLLNPVFTPFITEHTGCARK